MSSSWFEQLESQLEQQLEAFLGSHPGQQDLLEREEQLERQRRLRLRRLQIQAQAEQLRQTLLQVAGEITQWQQRVQRARSAGALELASRAEAHQGQLMGQGRDHWQQLGELGKEFARVEQELQELEQRQQAQPKPKPKPSGEGDLEQAWAHFESRQELEELRRRSSPSSP
ncbi:MAG: hercynine metabolism protein [Cyanobium sp. CZS 48M]|nr:hercynine metabolism protein [Cyanobium sp. CZS48M]